MIVAKIYPEAAKRGRGNKSSLTEQFSSGKLAEARLVLKMLRELADQGEPSRFAATRGET